MPELYALDPTSCLNNACAALNMLQQTETPEEGAQISVVALAWALTGVLALGLDIKPRYNPITSSPNPVGEKGNRE